MVTITVESETDVTAREALLNRAFGRNRRRKTSERLREGRLPAEGLAFAARTNEGEFVGTVRLWDIEAGAAGPALLLGPLAVSRHHREHGIGSALMRHAIGEAKRLGCRAILLVGDAAYYNRFGFSREAAGALRLPGPVQLDRFLGLELVPGALLDAAGILAATGQLEPSAAPRRRMA